MVTGLRGLGIGLLVSVMLITLLAACHLHLADTGAGGDSDTRVQAIVPAPKQVPLPKRSPARWSFFSPFKKSQRPSPSPSPPPFPASIPNEHTHELDVLVKQRSFGPDRSIAITMVSHGMLDFTYNWLCSVRRFKFTNYVILASDNSSFTSLRAAGEPVVLTSSFLKIEDTFLQYGTVAYQALMHFRVLYIKHLLEKNYHVLLFDVDQIWFANPFLFINATDQADIYTQNDSAPQQAGVICMGFIYLRPTKPLLEVWEDMRKQHAAKFQPERTSFRDKDTEQSIFDSIRRKLKVHYLHRELFANGKVYWSEERRVIVPVQIHDNWVVGREKKLERLIQRNLWMLEDDTPTKCYYSRLEAHSPVPVPPRQLSRMVLTIKIVPSQGKLADLGGLVESLLRADYNLHQEAGLQEKELRIDIELFVPSPQRQRNEEKKEGDDDAYLQASLRLKQEWKQGEVRMVPMAGGHGGNESESVELYLRAWEARSDEEAAIFVDHSVVVSSQWMRWVRHGLGVHYSRLDNFEPRMSGLVLERNTAFILRDQSSLPVGGLLTTNNKTQAFFFQNVGYHANLILPHHWRRFREWKSEVSAGEDSSSFLLSLLDLDVIRKAAGEKEGAEIKDRFYMWWIRFTLEHGFVCLHPPTAKTFARHTGHADAELFDASDLPPFIAPAPLYKRFFFDIMGKGWPDALHLEGLFRKKPA